MRYKGTHKGKVFDESKGKGFTFRLGEQPLLGWGGNDFCALSAVLVSLKRCELDYSKHGVMHS